MFATWAAEAEATAQAESLSAWKYKVAELKMKVKAHEAEIKVLKEDNTALKTELTMKGKPKRMAVLGESGPAQDIKTILRSSGQSSLVKNKAKCAMPGDAHKTKGVIGTLQCPGAALKCPDSLSKFKWLHFTTGGKANCIAFGNKIVSSGATYSVTKCHWGGIKPGRDKTLCEKYFVNRVTTKAQVAKLNGDLNSIMVAFKRVVCDDRGHESKACVVYKIGFCVKCRTDENAGKNWFRNPWQANALRDEVTKAGQHCTKKAMEAGRVKDSHACNNKMFRRSQSFMEGF